MWKWERREKKQAAEKDREIMHGKGLKRLENALENRAKYAVKPGTKFTDEKRNRELEVVRRCDIDPDYWFAKMINGDTKTQYRYSKKFIQNNLVY